MGKIYDFTISHQNAIRSFANEVPYVIAVVELEESARLMMNLIGIETDPAKTSGDERCGSIRRRH